MASRTRSTLYHAATLDRSVAWVNGINEFGLFIRLLPLRCCALLGLKVTLRASDHHLPRKNDSIFTLIAGRSKSVNPLLNPSLNGSAHAIQDAAGLVGDSGVVTGSPCSVTSRTLGAGCVCSAISNT